mmetsp:Transcript_23958/g.52128  ORF Transcript_23958/g.52128 Transcript_23958/m.52128 type:complete len:209 (-) Transcript_23958:323-949(-)
MVLFLNGSSERFSCWCASLRTKQLIRRRSSPRMRRRRRSAVTLGEENFAGDMTKASVISSLAPVSRASIIVCICVSSRASTSILRSVVSPPLISRTWLALMPSSGVINTEIAPSIIADPTNTRVLPVPVGWHRIRLCRRNISLWMDNLICDACVAAGRSRFLCLESVDGRSAAPPERSELMSASHQRISEHYRRYALPLDTLDANESS